MFQAIAIAFIVAAFGGAAFLAQRPTTATGPGLAHMLHGLHAYHDKPESAIVCPDGVAIGPEGARFACTVDGDDVSCALYRSGSISCN